MLLDTLGTIVTLFLLGKLATSPSIPYKYSFSSIGVLGVLLLDTLLYNSSVGI